MSGRGKGGQGLGAYFRSSPEVSEAYPSGSDGSGGYDSGYEAAMAAYQGAQAQQADIVFGKRPADSGDDSEDIPLTVIKAQAITRKKAKPSEPLRPPAPHTAAHHSFSSSSSGFDSYQRKEAPARKTVKLKKPSTKRIEERRAKLSEESRRSVVKHGHASKYNVLSRALNSAHVRKITK